MESCVEAKIKKMGYRVNTKPYGYIDVANMWYRNEIIDDFHKRTTIQGEQYEIERIGFAKRGCADDAKLDTFKDVDVTELNKTIKDLKAENARIEQDYKDKEAQRDFDDLIKDAITGAHGKNAKAITALLDVDTLMQSKNQKEDIAAAIKKLTEAEDSKMLFGEPEPQARGGGSPIGRIGDDSHPNTTDSISSALKEYYKK